MSLGDDGQLVVYLLCPIFYKQHLKEGIKRGVVRGRWTEIRPHTAHLVPRDIRVRVSPSGPSARMVRSQCRWAQTKGQESLGQKGIETFTTLTPHQSALGPGEPFGFGSPALTIFFPFLTWSSTNNHHLFVLY